MVLSRVDGPLSFYFTVDSTQISPQDILSKFQGVECRGTLPGEGSMNEKHIKQSMGLSHAHLPRVYWHADVGSLARFSDSRTKVGHWEGGNPGAHDPFVSA